jgi:hypothetical protein
MNIATAFRRLVTFPMCLLYVALVIYSRRKTWFGGRREHPRAVVRATAVN